MRAQIRPIGRCSRLWSRASLKPVVAIRGSRRTRAAHICNVVAEPVPLSTWDSAHVKFTQGYDCSPPDLPTVLKSYKKLQNGSDIRGVALDAVAGEPITLTPASAYFIGRAFALWLKQRDPHSPTRAVAIGRDPRITGALMVASLTSGIASAGIPVHDFGLATTPAMFYATLPEVSGLYAGAIMVTASHMPLQNNGMKFFTAAGGLDKPDIATLLQIATSECMAAGVKPGDWLSDHGWVVQRTLATGLEMVQQVDFMFRYAEILREVIKKGVVDRENYNFPLLGFKIAVDAGNGSGGFFARQVLAPLGADVSGSQFLEPNGLFPNHIPNPENAKAMEAAVQAVLRSGADLGIIFDTDVDRAAIVDSRGRPIDRNRMIALMVAITLRDHPGSTIVTDSVTSNGLTAFIQGLGGKHLRFKRGYKNVIGKGVELNGAGVACHLMMETSGHGAVKENYFLDDGAYLATLAVVELVRRRRAGEDLSDFLDALPEPVEGKEIRIKIMDQDFKKVGGSILEEFKTWLDGSANGKYNAGPPSNWSLEAENFEGWRINVDEGEGKRGWLLLRVSLHDPLMVLNIESDTPGGVEVIRQAVLPFFSREQPLPLDLSKLKEVTTSA